jgi:AraC-like DNA-binding protein
MREIEHVSLFGATALALLPEHGRERDWDLARLAKEAGMSRTAFSVRFHELVGEPPLKYATRCRMDRAAGLLRSTDATIVHIAARVGYDSEIGFGRAFKRHTGVSPAAYRRMQAVARDPGSAAKASSRFQA